MSQESLEYNPIMNDTPNRNSFTLLDHYAGLAMQGILAHYGLVESNENLSINSYNIAQQMLKKRKEINNG